MNSNRIVEILFCFFLIDLALIRADENQNLNIELNNFRFLPSYDNSWIDPVTLRLTKLKRNVFTISGDFEIKRNLGNQQRVEIAIHRKDMVTQKYVISIVKLAKPLCDFMESDTYVYPQLEKTSNVVAHDVCPFPKGKYTIRNYVAELKSFPPQTVPGDYKLALILYDRQKAVGGFEVEAEVTKN